MVSNEEPATSTHEPEHLIWTNCIREKNTFLHYSSPWIESLRGFEPVRRQNSEPTSGSSQLENSSGSYETFYRPKEALHAPVRSPECPAVSSSHDCGLQTELGNASESPDACGDLRPIENHQWTPEWSVGAGPDGIYHTTGKCKPCAWSWKPRGCARGDQCEQCHLCDHEALKRYRKARYAGLKANRAKKKQQATPIGKLSL
mmetsp:Transcript_67150/g.105625  ORF Transcript_67150/g.105625 Transcript_67150/m.105625 type:complete len:202 (-) Transcript_67150:128-733(-)